MRNEPLSKIELYKKLLPLKPIMDKFKETGNARIEPTGVALMQEVYPSVQVLGAGAMPLTINGGCPSCIAEAFHIFISVFDRLAADPHVTETSPASDGLGHADGKHLDDQGAEDLTEAEEGILTLKLGTDIADSTDFITRLRALSIDPSLDTVLRRKITNKLPELEEAYKQGQEDALKAELSSDEEVQLLQHLGLEHDVDPATYLSALSAHIDSLPEPGAKLTNKEAKLKAVIASLPPVQVTKTEPIVPVAVAQEPANVGQAVNAPDTRSPQQKAADNRKINAAAKAAREAAEGK